MVDGCWQEKGVPHVRTHDDRHTGLPRPLPQLRRPPRLLRRPVGNPRTCAARRGNAVHGGVSAVFRVGARHAKMAQAQAQHVFYKRVGGPTSFLDKANGARPHGNVPPTLRSNMADTMAAAIAATHGIRAVMICPKLAKKLQIYTRS